ncbi:TetR family transcriptional regulator [Saccharomonospora piscinae]|uniref:TetR family transcriptional regulator n=1 Tax=Saccharomonospora piscinae TaxID=687388 RepID=A0A1V9A1J5_SACPI|nr:TetR family transcriptional regulator [Saccharomonospora piscinae]OQO90898.1 TetR family transcriptional regulator [Saccharomonospora piscinae]TLW93587.1 TetR family transcriptional regulator [Saccharomonospora piscinae]
MTAPEGQQARPLPLRERKKLRTRTALEDTALRLFHERGFDATTLDDLVEAVEVSKRTFFRNYASKEDVALAAEIRLWDTYIETLRTHPMRGRLLDMVRDCLTSAVRELGPDWDRRFIATRRLIAGTPALRDRSLLLSVTVPDRVVEVLEDRTGIDGRQDVRLRLVGELALSAWRCGAKNWVAGRGFEGRRGHGGTEMLIRRVEEAFAAVPGAVALPVR